MGVVVVIAPLECVRSVNLGHVVPEFHHDIVRTVRGANTPGAEIGKIFYRKSVAAVGPVGYANPLALPVSGLGGKAVGLRGARKGRIRSVILPPVVSARIEAVQQGWRDRVVVAEAINVGLVVPGIARK